MSLTVPKSKAGGFFVGYYKKVPPDIALFCLGVGCFLVGAFAALSFGLATTTDDPVAASYIPGIHFSGTYRALPYPMVRVAADADHPGGHTLLLGGQGKAGAQQAGQGLEGESVDVSGALLKRGSIDMLIVDTLEASKNTASAASDTAVTAVGRWRIGGEICDGKCKAGAMKPGAGLAHKACANLCILGGLPPVLVTQEPVLGANFLLLADETGGPVPRGTLEDFVARPVNLEGAVERIGDVLVLKSDWKKAAFP